MRTLIVLGIGALIGVGIIAAMQHPKQVAKQAHVAVDTVEVKIEGMTRDQCVRQFYRETSCLQNRPQKECEFALEVKCGRL